MRWIPRSLAGQMALIAVPGILAAAGGLAWFTWSMADDEHRLAGIAESVHRGALESAGRQAAGLGDISASAAAHADAVREIQIEFRLQVLAFKSLLIRGERPDQREKFQGEFELRARNVQDRLRSLQAALAGDTQAVALLTAFAKAQAKLTASYRNAWGMLDLADDYNQGIHRADDYMVGRDAEPDRLLDQLTSLVLADSKRRVAQALDANRVAMAAALDAGGQRLGGAIESALERNQRCGIIAIAVLVAAGGALLWLLHRRLRPLRATAAALDGLAAGDLSARLQVRSGDEIGRMSYALNRSLEAIATTLGSRRVDWQAIAAARGRHAKRLGQDLLRTAEEMEQVSLQVASDGREIDGQAGRVNAEWLRIGQDIQAMAAAIEELNASLGTVAGNSQRSSEAVGRTNGHAVAAAKAVEEMLQAANQVGEAVQLIAKISSQVNLLALNATIEAARAGEAGRGFTVVANEVKHLAGDTRATAAEIAARVEAMQAASRRSAEAIRAITELMDTAAPLVAEVGSEVAQQAATVSSVSTSISRVAHDGRDLQAAAERLARTTTAATATADATREAAQVLKRLSADLREVLGQDDASEADAVPEALRPMAREMVGAA